MKRLVGTALNKSVAMSFALIVCLFIAQSALAARWYVNINASGGDGTDWSLAFNDLHDALNNPFLTFGDEIWVAAGTYTGNYALPERVRLYGGFEGWEGDLADRAHVGNIFTHETILTGGLTGTDIGGGIDDADSGDRTYVNGFTITGTGVTLINAAPVFIRCRFIDITGAPPSVSVFGAFDPQGANRGPIFSNCEFIGNEAFYGAGVWLLDLFEAEVQLTNCVFANNVGTSQHAGAAIRARASSGRIKNCTFFRNATTHSVLDDGGAVRLEGWGEKELTWHVTNNIFWANADEHGNRTEDAQIFIHQGATYPINLIFNNNIVDGLTGNLGGQNNIDADPMFISETTPDLRLQGGSPAIDTGHNTSVPGDVYNVADNLIHNPNRPTPDLDLGARRIINGIVDRGPYEYVPEGDLTGSGTVGWEDMDALLANYGCEGDCVGDFNLDEKVDGEDVAALLELMEEE